jgi:ribosomal-protein-alanine N-acetyltransferase
VHTQAIETNRLVLRPWTEDDTSHLSKLATNPVVVRFIGDGTTWSPERVEDVSGRNVGHWDEHGFGWRSAHVKETSAWIGFVGLNHVPEEAIEITEPEVEIGWWLDPSYWGRGIAKEGAVALRDEGFARVGLDRIIGRFQPENVASGRIMEALGMTFERDAVGRHSETVRIYALSRDRWARGRTSPPGP